MACDVSIRGLAAEPSALNREADLCGRTLDNGACRRSPFSIFDLAAEAVVCGAFVATFCDAAYEGLHSDTRAILAHESRVSSVLIMS